MPLFGCIPPTELLQQSKVRGLLFALPVESVHALIHQKSRNIEPGSRHFQAFCAPRAGPLDTMVDQVEMRKE